MIRPHWVKALGLLSFGILPLATLNGILQVLSETPSHFNDWLHKHISPSVSLGILGAFFVVEVVVLLTPRFRDFLVSLSRRAVESFREAERYPEEDLAQLEPQNTQAPVVSGPAPPHLPQEEDFQDMFYDDASLGGMAASLEMEPPLHETLEPEDLPAYPDFEGSAEYERANEPVAEGLQEGLQEDLNYDFDSLKQDLVQSRIDAETSLAEPDDNPFDFPIDPVPEEFGEHLEEDLDGIRDPGFDILSSNADSAAGEEEEPLPNVNPVQLAFEHAHLERPPFFADETIGRKLGSEAEAIERHRALDPQEQHGEYLAAQKDAARQEKILLRIQETDGQLVDEYMADELLQREKNVGNWREDYGRQIPPVLGDEGLADGPDHGEGLQEDFADFLAEGPEVWQLQTELQEESFLEELPESEGAHEDMSHEDMSWAAPEESVSGGVSPKEPPLNNLDSKFDSDKAPEEFSEGEEESGAGPQTGKWEQDNRAEGRSIQGISLAYDKGLPTVDFSNRETIVLSEWLTADPIAVRNEETVEGANGEILREPPDSPFAQLPASHMVWNEFKDDEPLEKEFKRLNSERLDSEQGGEPLGALHTPSLSEEITEDFGDSGAASVLAELEDTLEGLGRPPQRASVAVPDASANADNILLESWEEDGPEETVLEEPAGENSRDSWESSEEFEDSGAIAGSLSEWGDEPEGLEQPPQGASIAEPKASADTDDILLESWEEDGPEEPVLEDPAGESSRDSWESSEEFEDSEAVASVLAELEGTIEELDRLPHSNHFGLGHSENISADLETQLQEAFDAPEFGDEVNTGPESLSIAEAAEESVRDRERREEERAKKMLVPPVRKSWGNYDIAMDQLLGYDPEEEKRSSHIDPETEEAGKALLKTLRKFNIEAEMTHILKGPSITEFGILPAAGIKLSRVEALATNLAMELAARSIRIVAPIPGKKAVGIEIPNRKRSTVSFPALMDSESMREARRTMQLPIILGKEINGEIQIADLRRTPHLLIAGATGSGKSVCVNVIISSLILSRTPRELRLLMIDPKIVELKQYNDIPHLLTPVITDARRALQALQWVSSEMERRYALLDAIGAGNKGIESYNRYIKEKNMATMPLEFIVVIVDEFADLMSLVGKELEGMISRLAAMSRAVGIHLVLATQRPSVDVVTGLIKANFPTRIAFMVASQTDSRTILDQKGAEQLLGQGDMLFSFPGQPLVRAQGAYLSEEEAERISSHIKTFGEPAYLDEIIFEDEDSEETHSLDSGSDDLFPQAVEIALQAGEISTSYLQRKLSIGYNRAARIVDEMENRGIIGPAQGSKKREVLQSA
ncbi:MAG: DNA translocase FtsK [Spirochaetota bacterium]